MKNIEEIRNQVIEMIDMTHEPDENELHEIIDERIIEKIEIKVKFSGYIAVQEEKIKQYKNIKSWGHLFLSLFRHTLEGRKKKKKTASLNSGFDGN